MPIDARAFEVLPGFATALDEEPMKAHLQAALFGSQSEYVVERCTPRRPLYMPGGSCLLRYRFRARSSASGAVLEPIVTGRLFPSAAECASYMSGKLAPVAARLRGRADVAAFAAPAAPIEPLNMVVYVWPVDGELPGLAEATDRDRMVEILRELLSETLDDPFVVSHCELELVTYRRRERCVLRYTIAGEDTDGVGRRLVAYGKLSGVGTDTPTDVIVDELHRRVGHELSIPRSFGRRPDLRLSLLEAVAGEPLIGPALGARLRGDPSPGALSLEEMIAACGHAAAALHGSGVTLGPARTIDDVLDGLRRDMEIVRPFVADAERAQAWFDQVAGLAEQSEPLRPCLTHGDFKYEQLLFDDARSALVDFDALCQAEPALDLGKFLAHLRVDAEVDELAEQFLSAYVAACGVGGEDERHLRGRTAVYEAVWLLHLTLWSRRNLDESGTQAASRLLEERLAAA